MPARLALLLLKRCPPPAFWRGLLLLVSLLCLSSCNSRSTEAAVFLPPTRLVTSTSTPTSTPEIFLPTPTAAPTLTPTAPPCANNLKFIDDATIPDGTKVKSGEALDKRWQVQNSGDCNWDQRYHVKLSDGPDLGAPIEQALYPARAGTELTIQMTFTAPLEAGRYRSAWQAYDAAEQPFGDLFYIDIVVVP